MKRRTWILLALSPFVIGAAAVAHHNHENDKYWKQRSYEANAAYREHLYQAALLSRYTVRAHTRCNASKCWGVKAHNRRW